MHDIINPTDNNALGKTFEALIVDVNDPKEDGRVKIRVLGYHQEDRVPDENLPWVHCSSPNQPSLRGIGFFPPNYLPGSVVLCVSRGSQDFTILGSISNAAKEQDKKDINREARSSTPLSILKNKNIHEKLLNIKGTKQALNLRNFDNTIWQITDGIHKEIINEAKVPIEYGLRTAAKAFDIPSIGFDKFSGDMKSAQNFIKGKIGDAGSVIPGALDMIKNLHSIKNTLGVPDPLSIIGQQNLLKAAKGLLDLIKKKKKQDEDSTPPEEKKEETEEERLAREAKEKELQDLIDNTQETPTT